MMVVESVIVVGVTTLVHRRARPVGEPFVRFSLKDLLFFTVMAAIFFSLAGAPRTVWTTWGWVYALHQGSDKPSVSPWCVCLAQGVLGAAVVLIATWAVLGKAKRWKRVVLSLLFLLLAYPGVVAATAWLFYGKRYGCGAGLEAAMEFVWWTGVYLVTAVLIMGWLGLLAGRRRLSETPRGDARRLRHFVSVALAVLTAVLVVPPAGLLWTMAAPAPMEEVDLPEPNGYDVLLRVAEDLEGCTIPRDNANPREIQAFSSKYADPLRKAKAALETECQVVVVCTPEYWAIAQHSPSQKLRRLARAMEMMGRAKMIEEDPAAAADWYLATLEMGAMLARGGTYWDRHVGSGIEYSAMARLCHDRDELPSSVRRHLIERLIVLARSKDSIDQCLDREKAWQCNALGWKASLWLIDEECGGGDQEWRETTHAYDKKEAAWYSILITELALVEYYAKHGAYPAELEKLTPDFLDEAPRDPFSQGPLVYRLTEKGYRLYSVGRNGVDDKGECEEKYPSEADDIFFDTAPALPVLPASGGAVGMGPPPSS
ncbi:MAG: hypothetical protein JW818_14030 [Pirellulales bacterium]|nr:hypothetical protein [Pirellulales bacterium]